MRHALALALAVVAWFAPAARAQELADAEAERAHIAFADTVAATLEAGSAREALVSLLFDQAAARRGGRAAQARMRRAWSRALAAGPDDPLVHWIAVTNCPFGPEGCEPAASLRRLAALEPDNGAVWHVALNRALAARDAVTARDALARLARAERYDAHLTELLFVLDAALAQVPVPDALRRLGDEEVDEATARGIAVFGVLLAVVSPEGSPLIRYCTPNVDAAFESRRADCAAAGERIATRSDTLLHRWLGTRVWLRVARGGPDEARARKAARDHSWQSEAFADTIEDGVGGAKLELERRRTHRTELAAVAAALRDAGIPLEAPPGFVPASAID